MMKTQFLAAAALGAALLVSACGGNAYRIDGTVEDPSLEGTVVYKVARFSITDLIADPTQQMPMDSTYIADGKYAFSGEVSEPDYCTLYIGKDAGGAPAAHATVVLEPGAKIAVVTGVDRKTRVSGTPSNELVQENETAGETLRDRFLALREQYAAGTLSTEESARIEAEMDEIRQQMEDLDFQFVKENINNPAAWEKLYNAAVMAGSLEKQKELIAGAEGRTKELKDYQTIVGRIERLEKTAVGQPFVDISLEDPDGNPMHLSDYAGKGKCILVDFWASWCGPCKAEMPNVVALYKQYKDKGFDIVSVSLDSHKDRWVKAIQEWGMPWHHMSDLKGWDCEGAALYAVTAIPHTVLLGPDGTILARNLTGDDLRAKLEELLP